MQIETKLLIADGDIVVIGGIKKNSIKNNKQQLPGMGNVPVLGNLFKGSQKQDMLTEMLRLLHQGFYRMLKISRESEINLINVLIDNDIISGKDLPNIKKLVLKKINHKLMQFLN